MKKRVVRFSVSLVILVGIGFALVLMLLTTIGAYSIFPPHEPQYCWLDFGPAADVRVLVCMDGETVSLEHYANGAITGRKETFRHRSECKDINVADPDGNTSYVITEMSGKIAKPGVPTELFVNVDIKGHINYYQGCDVVEMRANPDSAPIAHFHGPLAVEIQTIYWQVPSDLVLRRGDKATDIRVTVGTMNARKGCWVVVQTHDGKSPFPKGIHPFVDIEFPAANKDEPPIKRRYSLDEFC